MCSGSGVGLPYPPVIGGDVRQYGSGNQSHGRDRSGWRTCVRIAIRPCPRWAGVVLLSLFLARIPISGLAMSRQTYEMVVAFTVFLGRVWGLTGTRAAIVGWGSVLIRTEEERRTTGSTERLSQIRRDEANLRYIGEMLSVSNLAAAGSLASRMPWSWALPLGEWKFPRMARYRGRGTLRYGDARPAGCRRTGGYRGLAMQIGLTAGGWQKATGPAGRCAAWGAWCGYGLACIGCETTLRPVLPVT